MDNKDLPGIGKESFSIALNQTMTYSPVFDVYLSEPEMDRDGVKYELELVNKEEAGQFQGAIDLGLEINFNIISVKRNPPTVKI